MTNFDTVVEMTDNIHEVLRKAGIHFSKKAYDDEKNLPASFFPVGRIFYTGEAFENAHNQKPFYADAEFTITVQLLEADPADMIREQQRWVHLIREALTVEALNINGLANTRYITRVNISRIDVENQRNRSGLICKASVRYREI